MYRIVFYEIKNALCVAGAVDKAFLTHARQML
jgi:hypothetical protein